MAKHTPGPWIEEANGAPGVRVQRGKPTLVMAEEGRIAVYAPTAPPGSKLIAETYGMNGLANARLIAAAPELADALEALANAAADFASSETDMPSHAETEQTMEQAFYRARATLKAAGRGE